MFLASDLALLKDLVETGKLRPVVEPRYPPDQIVEAHWYVEQGPKRGNVIVAIAHD